MAWDSLSYNIPGLQTLKGVSDLFSLKQLEKFLKKRRDLFGQIEKHQSLLQPQQPQIFRLNNLKFVTPNCPPTTRLSLQTLIKLNIGRPQDRNMRNGVTDLGFNFTNCWHRG